MKITVIGGSNSLLKTGYVPVVVNILEQKTGEFVELNNLAIGNTFSHFGFWQIITKNNHHDSDVIIIEYALNDQELSSSRLFNQWANIYEGIISKLRRDNPRAQIIAPLFMTRKAIQKPKITTFLSGAALINLRYNVESIDVTQLLYSLGGALYWDAPKDWYKDGPHYNKNIQAIIGREVADRIQKGAGLSFSKEYFPVSSDFFISPKSAVKEGLIQEIFHCAENSITYKNSLIEEKAAVFTKKAPLKFSVKGKLLALIVISTKDDGVIKINFNNETAFASLRRKIFDNESSKFLLNILVPDQYFKHETLPSIGFEDYCFSVSEDYKDVCDRVVCRGSARIPDDGVHSLAVVDILYVGEIRSID